MNNIVEKLIFLMFLFGLVIFLFWDYSFAGMFTPVETRKLEDTQIIEGRFYVEEGSKRLGSRTTLGIYGIKDEKVGELIRLTPSLAPDRHAWKTYHTKPAKAWVIDDPMSKKEKLVYQLMIDGNLTFDINSANNEVNNANKRWKFAAFFGITVAGFIIWATIKFT